MVLFACSCSAFRDTRNLLRNAASDSPLSLPDASDESSNESSEGVRGASSNDDGTLSLPDASDEVPNDESSSIQKGERPGGTLLAEVR